MSLKGLLKLSVVAIVVYVGVQFASVYVAKLQLSHILETEAMEARRHKYAKAEIIQNIISHMNRTNTDLPHKMQVGITGIGEPEETLHIELDYKHVVDLQVRKVVLSMTASGDSAPPID